MKQRIETTHQTKRAPSGILEITTTTMFDDDRVEVKPEDAKRPIKIIVVMHWIEAQYIQTHIYDEWGYKTLWYDNHGGYQHFDRKIKTEGKPSEIGQIDGKSWFVTNTKFGNTFKGKVYSDKDFRRMRERFFCEPYPEHIKEIP